MEYELGLASWKGLPSTSDVVRAWSELVGGGSREQVCDLRSDTDDVSVSVTIGPAPESSQRPCRPVHVKTAPPPPAAATHSKQFCPNRL